MKQAARTASIISGALLLAAAAAVEGCDCGEPYKPSTAQTKSGSSQGQLIEAVPLVLPARPKGQPAPASAPAAPASAPAAPAASPLPPPPPLKLGRLVVEDSKKVTEKLQRAHYDPEALGLRELEYSVIFMSKHLKTEARGKGSWKSGSPPTFILERADREGKVATGPGDTEETAQVWADLQERIHRLIDGLTNGYLSRRIEDWQKQTGKVKMKGGKLELSFRDKDNSTTVVVGEGYRVEEVKNHYDRGITRSVDYTTRVEDGRNLVVRALLHASVDAGAKLPKRATLVMTAADKTLSEIGYAKVGRYFMPVLLRKVIPNDSEEINLTITYKAARP